MTEPPDRDSLVAFFDRWTDLVRAVDFDTARAMFDPDLVAFGTFADFITERDAVIAGQWRQVWPTIADYRFRTEAMHCDVSPDRLMATVAVPWSSTGFREDGRPFERNGRATVTLRRDGLAGPWRGVHTHLSLNRGTPDRSFGRPTALA
ncbi:ketosteroid isomerase-like protein [Stella humosa]|uniref:Ketosteroid isomerase-like protein n=1 Tax=Stella humosa TaxID=94 RepID=A0A3N1ME32_9PROT|nr:nuclear transport factor 2 family protein [Stella humosa]ROQ01818.1 ketosteroid isomerase-like protein [Stella humosa]